MSKEFVSLEPMKTWIIINSANQGTPLICCKCFDLLNARGFKAIYYKDGLGGDIIKTEYYCNKDAKKTFPHYFK